MDIMQIKSSLMKGIVAKILSKAIFEKSGYKVKVKIEDIDIKVNEEKASVNLNAGFDINIKDLTEFARILDD